MQSVLITGGAGYIGSHVAYLLAQQKVNVIVLDAFNHRQQFNPPWATVVRGDYADKKLLCDIFSMYNIQAVIHCAGFIEVADSVQRPLSFYENNVAKTVKLIELMVEHEVKNIIFSSSCAVYGTPEYTPIDEAHTTTPISPYGKTKLMIEAIIHDCAQAYDISYINLRYFNASGALAQEQLGEQHQPETHLIPLALRAALKNTPFTAYGQDFETRDGSAIRDFVHVLDIAQAHVCAYDHVLAQRPSDTFNLGTGNGQTVKEIITAVEHICRTKIKVIWQAPRKGDPPVLVADAAKACNILRWQPRYSHLDFIIQSAFSFEQQRAKLACYQTQASTTVPR